MGLESFELPRGSAGDVAELEYISALHQTGSKSDTPDGAEHQETGSGDSPEKSEEKEGTCHVSPIKYPR